MKLLNNVIGALLCVTPLVLLPAMLAADPVAIVEDVAASRADVQLMDFLDEGTSISLEGGGSMVLGYLNSCIREEIRGGIVLVGKNQSEVEGGDVRRETLSCDGGRNKTQAGRKRDAGVIVFRKAASKKPPVVDQVVYGTHPVIRTGPDVTGIKLSRLDGRGPVQDLAIRNGLVDMAKPGIRLRKNTTYKLSSGDKSMTFKVSGKATDKASLLSRLIRFQGRAHRQ